MHAYSINQIVGFFWDGVLWFVLAVAGLARFVAVPQQAPDWWERFFSWGDWYYGSDEEWHPRRELAERLMLGAWLLLAEFISESAHDIADGLFDALRNLIGWLPYWAGSVASGLGILLGRIGEGYLFWAANAIQALQRIFDWLPNEIKYAGLSWAQLFDSIRASIYAWVAARYDEVRGIALQSLAWLSQWGDQIADWYLRYQAWLGEFIDHPASTIAFYLGEEWARLAAFERSALGFYFNLWSASGQALSDFLADPGGWIMQRIEDEMNRRWE